MWDLTSPQGGHCYNQWLTVDIIDLETHNITLQPLSVNDQEGWPSLHPTNPLVQIFQFQRKVLSSIGVVGSAEWWWCW